MLGRLGGVFVRCWVVFIAYLYCIFLLHIYIAYLCCRIVVFCRLSLGVDVWSFGGCLESIFGRFGGSEGCLERSFGVLRGLGPLLGDLGSLLGRSWPVLGGSWLVLGRSWLVLGHSWPLLGRSRACLGGVLGALGGVLVGLGALLVANIEFSKNIEKTQGTAIFADPGMP